MSNLPVPAYGDDNIGLEDFDTTDMVMPTLRLDHTEGVLVDTLSQEKYEKISVVLLGLVKQRILWPPEVGEVKENPLCRSLDFVVGTPDPQKPERFPWAQAGFDQASSGSELNCSDCKLKDWGSGQKNDSPWCTEQWTFPLMMQQSEANWAPATLTLQRSNIKPLRAYLSDYVRSGRPLFTNATNITLQQNKRGTVKYVTVGLAKGAATPDDLHETFRTEFLRIRTWLRTPRNQEAEVETTVNNPRAAASVEIDEDF